ncbi:hypothetical protein [Bacillus sp. B15-48]|uniref:hypothetical protein n=1 Tax=Bacillus sp. B15-48 TaxID=1548601 RepID=UPI001EF21A58|nr:hypothetical protein [Bacillus sp. B15-48]
MLIKDVYLDSITYEQSSLAHYLYHLLAEQKISLDDKIDRLDFNQADHQKVAELIENNVLKFRKIGVYSLKMTQRILPLSLPAVSERPSNSIRKPFSNPH